MYRKPLPRVSPEQVGISSRMLLSMFRELESATEMHGFMLARHGQVAAEAWWAPYTPQLPHICHSLGKSYVGTAVGLACTQGYLHLEDRIVDLFADEIRQWNIPVTENRARLTIEHQLMMANGMSFHAASGENLLRNYLTTEVDHAPGERFLYNTTGSCMLGAAVMRAVGKPIRQYVTEELLNRIGIANDELEWMPFHGNGVHAAPGVATTAENNLRLGMLYLNYGKWEGKQLIDYSWMERATTRRIRTEEINKASHTDSGAGYGYQLWICPEEGTFKFSGGHGQDTIMCRPNDLVISFLGGMNDGMYKRTTEIVSRYLLSQKLSDMPLPEDPDNFRELKAYLDSRQLADRKTGSLPVHAEEWSGLYRVTEGEFHVGTELRPLDDHNVYTDFYDHEDVNARFLSLDVKDKYIDIVLDDGTIRTVLRAWLDGKLRPVATCGPIPIYRQTVSTAHMEQDGTMVIETKFLQTAFWTIIRLRRTPQGLEAEVLKERLHEDNPYIHQAAKLQKIL